MIGNIYINGQIGDFGGVKGVNLIDVIAQVKQFPEATSFNVHINSEGGYVDVGFDILNYLRSLGKPVTTIGTGIVASIATVIFMAGGERKVSENTKFMIHLPWGEGMGNADELEEYAKQLRVVEKQLLDFYKKELNLEEEALQPLMRDETWLTHDQLSTLGFTTSQPVMAVAKAYINSKPNKSSMTEEDKGFFTGIFAKLEKLLSTKPKNKVVQDATGTEINFEELADDAAIEVGANATVDGSPAEGEYVLPDGNTYVFSGGELTEIREPEEDELATLRSENQRLTQELADAHASHQGQLDSINKEFNALKAKVQSSFKAGGKKEKPNTTPSGAVENRFAGTAEKLKNLKRK